MAHLTAPPLRSLEQFNPVLDDRTRYIAETSPRIEPGLLELENTARQVIFVQAPTGLGKTELISHLRERRILVIAPRLVIIDDLVRRFPSFRSHRLQGEYLTSDELREIDRLVITPLSAYKLLRMDDWDFVVFDEPNQCFAELVGMPDKDEKWVKASFRTLQRLRDENRCLVMGSSIDSFTYQFFTAKNADFCFDIDGEDCFIDLTEPFLFYRNTFKNKEGRTLFVHSSAESLKSRWKPTGNLNVVEGSIEYIAEEAGIAIEDVLQAKTAERIESLKGQAGSNAEIADSQFASSVICSGLDLHCFDRTTILLKRTYGQGRLMNGDFNEQAANRARGADVDYYAPAITKRDDFRLLSPKEFETQRILSDGLRGLRFVDIGSDNRLAYHELDYCDYFYRERWNASYEYRTEQLIASWMRDGGTVLEWSLEARMEQDLEIISNGGAEDSCRGAFLFRQDLMRDYLGRKEFEASDTYLWLKSNRQALDKLFDTPSLAHLKLGQEFIDNPLKWFQRVLESYGYSVKREIWGQTRKGSKVEAKKNAFKRLKSVLGPQSSQEKAFLAHSGPGYLSAEPGNRRLIKDFLSAYEVEYLEIEDNRLAEDFSVS